MKSIKVIVTAALLAVSTGASAQFTNTSASSSSASTDGWGTVYVQWNPLSIVPDDDNADDLSFTGFSIGVNKAFSISSSMPLYLEAGVGLQYAHYSESEDDDELSYNLFSLKVPVSLGYAFQIPNSSISLAPFVGIDLRGNISGTSKYEHEYRGETESVSLNLFDKEDVGKDNTWKRFQLGWHIGVNAKFNNSFLVGLSYGQDFSEIYKDAKIHTTSVTIGYCF